MNRLLQTSMLSIRNLGLHKLRSFLTILGLVFGVASVIVMLAVAEGASAEAQRQSLILVPRTSSSAALNRSRTSRNQSQTKAC